MYRGHAIQEKGDTSMNQAKRKIIFVIMIIVFIGITGVLYSCNQKQTIQEQGIISFKQEESNEQESKKIDSSIQISEKNQFNEQESIKEKPIDETSIENKSNKINENQADKKIELDLEENTIDLEQENDTSSELGICYVHVCGAVKTPGVYQVKEGDRAITAITMAGGFSQEAAIDYVNQASILFDGQKLYIPTTTEVKEAGGTLLEENKMISQETTALFESKQKESVDGIENKKININEASREELMTLPGIGEAKANGIIGYREKQKKFETIEEIMKIEGIKQGVFEKIKDKIRIN